MDPIIKTMVSQSDWRCIKQFTFKIINSSWSLGISPVLPLNSFTISLLSQKYLHCTLFIAIHWIPNPSLICIVSPFLAKYSHINRSWKGPLPNILTQSTINRNLFCFRCRSGNILWLLNYICNLPGDITMCLAGIDLFSRVYVLYFVVIFE